MFFQSIILFSSSLFTTWACPEHSYDESGSALQKRAEGQDWAYEASYNWGMINENYTLCQTGTMQSPIPLLFTQGLSLGHKPTFSNAAQVAGTFLNWGYGPGFTVAKNLSSTTTVTFEDGKDGVNETAYLKGWHIHSPADHSVQADRSKAELHFVYGDASGADRAVFAFRVDPGNTRSAFFDQLPAMISFREKKRQIPISMDLELALEEVNHFSEFWTYRGSLTSPPCWEGIRWYVARNILFVSNEQMQSILAVSTYSARAEQEVWLHAINV
ncbi:carbonic anhydrase [Tothia fuscella]|uniref:Carbonic anhydrase n=1 Tax=Tothia fuscella TaxID=1048955 RepID=A0A9P4NFV5_9PEZI|nr:carbonic anhydrase [Tothia fuscella]